MYKNNFGEKINIPILLLSLLGKKGLKCCSRYLTKFVVLVDEIEKKLVNYITFYLCFEVSFVFSHKVFLTFVHYANPFKYRIRLVCVIIVSHFFFCGCNTHPLTIEGIMNNIEDSTFVVISQTGFCSDAIIRDSVKNVKIVNTNCVDTIQLNKLLGFSIRKRTLIFNRKGIYAIYPPVEGHDVSKINNSIDLAMKLSKGKKVPDGCFDNVFEKYNIYGLYLLFTQDISSLQKDSIAEYIWFNSSKEQKQIYNKECLDSYKHIYQFSNKENVIFALDNYKFNNIPLDTIINVVYTFRNIGHEKTLIEYVSTSCDCTKVFYPQKPIFSNQQDSIKIRYKPKFEGYNSSTVIVKFLYHKPIRLNISCVVI